MIKKYVKILGFFIISLLVMLISLNTFYYFDIISLKVFNIIRSILMVVIIFITGRKMGKNTMQHGYLEGVKLGGFLVVLFGCLGLLFGVKFSFNILIYYLLLFLVAVLGSMRGINCKKGK